MSCARARQTLVYEADYLTTLVDARPHPEQREQQQTFELSVHRLKRLWEFLDQDDNCGSASKSSQLGTETFVFSVPFGDACSAWMAMEVAGEV